MQVVSGPPDRPTVHFEAPPSSAVYREMSKFLSWWHTPASTDILRAGVAHVWFVTIHPFDDGNGRIARAITDMALAQSDGVPRRLWSLSAQIQEDRRGYYAALQAAQGSDGEITPWLRWFIGTVERALVAAEADVQLVLAKARFWNEQRDVLLNARQIKALNRLLDAGEGTFVGGMTTRKYASLTRTSRATAQRDLADLVAKDLLITGEGRGRSTHYDLRWHRGG